MEAEMAEKEAEIAAEAAETERIRKMASAKAAARRRVCTPGQRPNGRKATPRGI